VGQKLSPTDLVEDEVGSAGPLLNRRANSNVRGTCIENKPTGFETSLIRVPDAFGI